ncbi:hypothetical protein LCGC14_2293550, partial [marine sediment metagenome]
MRRIDVINVGMRVSVGYIAVCCIAVSRVAVGVPMVDVIVSNVIVRIHVSNVIVSNVVVGIRMR